MNDFPSGFVPDKIVATNVSLSGPQYKGWPEQRAYIEQLFRRIQTVPGVQATGIHCSNFNTSI